MKIYVVTFGAGLLAGVLYSLLGVRSPAPPVIALLGLMGILLGEQALPIARRLADKVELCRFVRTDCANHVLGKLPANEEAEA